VVVASESTAPSVAILSNLPGLIPRATPKALKIDTSDRLFMFFSSVLEWIATERPIMLAVAN